MNKKQFQLLSIALLTVVIIVSNLTRGGEPFEELPLIEQEIDRLVVLNGEEEIPIIKGDTGWTLGDRAYPADETKVTAMADALKGLKLDQLVSRGGDEEEYGLSDEECIRASLYSGGELLRSIRIGKSAGRGGGSYISLSGRKGIFLARGSLISTFGQELSDLRNKQIWALPQEGILSFKVQGPEESVELVRESSEEDEDRWIFRSSGKEADKSRVESFLQKFSRLTTAGFPEESLAFNRDTAPWKLEVSTQSRTVRLSMRPPSSEDGQYIVMSSEAPYPLSLSNFKGEALMVKANNFLLDSQE